LGTTRTFPANTSIWDEIQTNHLVAGTFGKYLDAQVSAVTAPSAATVAAAVRTNLATELARIDVTIGSRNATAPPTVEQIRGELDANSAAMAAIYNAINALNDYDGSDTAGVTELLTRLTGIRAGYLDALASGVPLATGIATQVRTELAAELANLDTSVSGVPRTVRQLMLPLL
jgi:hypothetical protein